MMVDGRDARLVVIEFGGSWPRWLDVGAPGLGGAGPSAAACVMLVAQHYEGASSSLLTQVASRITRLEGANWTLGNVVLVCNDRVDAEAVTARAVLARGLLERTRGVAPRHDAELVLALGEHSDGRARHALLRLAATLDRAPEHARPVRISVRIGDAEPLYGSRTLAA